MYLNEDLTDKTETNFEKNLTENEGKVVNKLVQQQLDNGLYDGKNSFNIYKNFKETENNNAKRSSNQRGGGESSTSSSSRSSRSARRSEKTEKSVGSKILSIIDRSKGNHENLELESSVLPFEVQENNNQLTPIVKPPQTGGSAIDNSHVSNMDSRIKDILNNDLGDSDLDETSVYNLEKDPSNYQEVFSNSVKEEPVNNIANSTDRRKNLEKNQFFANYLRV